MQYLRHILLVFVVLLFPLHVAAQELNAPTPPTFTAQSLEDRIGLLEAQVDLSDEQREAAIVSLRTAIERLNDATRQIERREQYEVAVENAQQVREEIDAELTRLRDQLEVEPEPMSQPNSEAELFELEQELIAKQSDLSELKTRLDGFDETLETFLARQSNASSELSEARTSLSELQTRLNNLGDGDLEVVSDARRTEVRAHSWYRRNQIKALEQEISTLPLRQELLRGRRAVADLKAQILLREEQQLSEETGQKRIDDARDLRNRIADQVEDYAEYHPIVAEYARTNLDFANDLAILAGVPLEGLGETGTPEQTMTMTSQRTIIARGQLVDIDNNLIAAQKLVNGGRLDREAGEVLRRLGRQLRKASDIREDLRESREALTRALRRQIIAQEDLRALPVGAFAINSVMNSAQSTEPTLPALTSEDRGALNRILETRRDLLQQLVTQATARINAVTELEAVQTELLSKTERLQSLLDENLLWVRSVPAIDKTFPQKVVLGTLEFFSVENLQLAVTELVSQARRYFLLVVGFVFITLFCAKFRPRIREDVNRRAALVGRVQDDSAWHTPAVIAAGLFNSLPLSFIFLLIGILYSLSNRTDGLIEGLANGFFFLALLNFIFATWMRWDREGGLFDAHFKVPDNLRRTVAVNLRWFVPLIATTSTFLAVTRNMSSENISEGFSVFVFILSGLAMMVFATRVLWQQRQAVAEFVAPDSILERFRGPITLVMVGLPLIAIILAAMGYFESADALFFRMFLSGALILLTYVMYSAIRRAIIVAQRQIKYKQALEKREAELIARRQKEEAEERGEDLPPPPPIDTSRIDVTTMTRQTSKLLQTAVLLIFAMLLWFIWSSLVPALSIFDGFEVWSYKTGNVTEGVEEVLAVSLWDVLQSLVILVLTFIAARNLPGFLEIFLLNRVGIDAGTRYAVTTVLGYIIIAIGVIIGFNQLGLQWSQLRWIVTGLSVGIGFGLQKIIANFVSGLIILFERPIRIGDYVTIGDQSGTVSRIKIRATTLSDLDNREILIPNEALIAERVTNWTLSSSITRLIVPVGIAYGTDTDAARMIMLDAIKDLPKVLSTPSPNVLFMGFGESSLDFEVRVFLKSFDDRVPMTHVIHTEINKALEKAGISIPFPQRDLNIISHNISETAIKTKSSPKRKKSAGPKDGPKPSKA